MPLNVDWRSVRAERLQMAHAMMVSSLRAQEDWAIMWTATKQDSIYYPAAPCSCHLAERHTLDNCHWLHWARRCTRKGGRKERGGRDGPRGIGGSGGGGWGPQDYPALAVESCVQSDKSSVALTFDVHVRLLCGSDFLTCKNSWPPLHANSYCRRQICFLSKSCYKNILREFLEDFVCFPSLEREATENSPNRSSICHCKILTGKSTENIHKVLCREDRATCWKQHLHMVFCMQVVLAFLLCFRASGCPGLSCT